MEYYLIPAASASAIAVNSAAELLSKQWGGSLEARKSQLLQKNFCWLFVFSTNHNEVVGHVKLAPGVQINSDLYGTAPSGVLTSVVIAESHRGKGIGTHLMRLVECEAGKQGFYTLILWTPDAMAFYSRLGYAPCEPRRSLTTLVASIDSISAKSISKLEQLFAKRAAQATEPTEAGTRDFTPAESNSNGSNMVWMQKRIRDEVPLQHIPLPALRRSIDGSVRNIVGSASSLEGTMLYLHCSMHTSSADPIASSDTNVCTGLTSTLPWSQQVGPSCGIQAIRFAEHILSGASGTVHCALSDSSLNCNTSTNNAVECTADSVSNGISSSVNMTEGTPTLHAANSPSLLSIAIERGYTSEGALYNIHLIVDLVLRNNTTLHGHADALVQSTSNLTAGQLCNLILGDNITPTNTNTTPNATNTSNPGYIIFPYDRDSTYSTPTALQGAAAHYALLVGCVILPAQTRLNSGASVITEGIRTDSTSFIDLFIDPARVLLVGLHGLTWNPIVASYKDFITSNAQLHCAGDKYMHGGAVPSLTGNMVVVRRKPGTGLPN